MTHEWPILPLGSILARARKEFTQDDDLEKYKRPVALPGGKGFCLRDESEGSN